MSEKFANSISAVLSVFGSSEWEAEGIKTYPSNYIAVNAGNEFIRVDVFPGGNGPNFDSVKGAIYIDIYTPAGSGPKRAAIIADKLDNHMAGKLLATPTGNVQMFESVFQNKGVDPENKTLHRSIYSINFTFFGVQ